MFTDHPPIVVSRLHKPATARLSSAPRPVLTRSRRPEWQDPVAGWKRTEVVGYQLGVDLGTTYCAAAVHRNDRVEIVTLGNRAASVPSVVDLREDGEMLVGESAERRASSDPQRSAREFKRRVGDPVPIVLGGETFSAEQLMARQLPPIIRIVTERQGAAPDTLTLTVPANWSAHRKAIFRDALPTDQLPPLSIITEPEAAAIHYAQNERIEPGEVVAVYDLGGGTFDAAILRRTEGSFEVLGTPEGIDRLGVERIRHAALTAQGAAECEHQSLFFRRPARVPAVPDGGDHVEHRLRRSFRHHSAHR